MLSLSLMGWNRLPRPDPYPRRKPFGLRWVLLCSDDHVCLIRLPSAQLIWKKLCIHIYLYVYIYIYIVLSLSLSLHRHLYMHLYSSLYTNMFQTSLIIFAHVLEGKTICKTQYTKVGNLEILRNNHLFHIETWKSWKPGDFRRLGEVGNLESICGSYGNGRYLPFFSGRAPRHRRCNACCHCCPFLVQTSRCQWEYTTHHGIHHGNILALR